MQFGGNFHIYMSCSNSRFSQLSHCILFVVVNKPFYNVVNNPSFCFWFGYSSLTVFDFIERIFYSVTMLLTVLLFMVQGFSSLNLILSILVQNRNFFWFWFLNLILSILVQKCPFHNSTEFQTSRKVEAKWRPCEAEFQARSLLLSISRVCLLFCFFSPCFPTNVSSSPLTCRWRSAADRQGRRLHFPIPTT